MRPESVGHDRQTNVSVLRVLEPPAEFSTIKLDAAQAMPQVGSIAIAITSPLDFEPTPVMGLFTGVERKLGNKVFPTSYIRTSIPVDGGQGGCPILDLNGRFHRHVGGLNNRAKWVLLATCRCACACT
jgi:S1-C subfamily serine protease